MTRRELTEIAKYGIEKKIEHRCKCIVDTWVSPTNLADLKELLEQYDGVMQEYDAACEEDTNAAK